MYQIDFSKRAVKELQRLGKREQLLIAGAIELLAINPFPPNCVRLQGRDGWRIRIGDYRVIYSVDGTQLVVLVIKIGHRRDVYHR